MLILARLGVSRKIYVNVDSPNLGFPYINFLGEAQCKNNRNVDNISVNRLASLKATLVRNYDPLTDLLTGVKCRATSVAKKHPVCIPLMVWI